MTEEVLELVREDFLSQSAFVRGFIDDGSWTRDVFGFTGDVSIRVRARLHR